MGGREAGGGDRGRGGWGGVGVVRGGGGRRGCLARFAMLVVRLHLLRDLGAAADNSTRTSSEAKETGWH